MTMNSLWTIKTITSNGVLDILKIQSITTRLQLKNADAGSVITSMRLDATLISLIIRQPDRG